MGNCLKTQLKEAVQNENLPILGKFRISFDNAENVGVGLFIIGEPIDLSEISCSGTLTVSKNASNYFIFNGTGVATIGNKYSITNLQSYKGTYSYSEIEYIPLDSLYFSENSVINNLNSWDDVNKWSNLTNLRLEKKNLTGTSVELPNLRILMLTSITGNLQFYSLGLLQNLTTLQIDGGSLYGTYEDFIRARRTWQPTGSITSGYNIRNTGTTFNGNITGGNITMSWTENTMTVNGVTIDA